MCLLHELKSTQLLILHDEFLENWEPKFCVLFDLHVSINVETNLVMSVIIFLLFSLFGAIANSMLTDVTHKFALGKVFDYSKLIENDIDLVIGLL